jgi:glycosyltransferase involved in cell wall biosynthesis
VTSPSPLVSVVIAVRDGERYLAEAIESVRRQTHAPVELIVVDDGSVDGSAAIATAYGTGLRYLHQAPAGLAAARNCGTEVANGAFLAFLDADDVWLEDKLRGQLAALAARPDVDAVFGHLEQFVSPELPADVQARLRPRDVRLAALSPCTMLIRTPAYRRVGGFDPRWTVGEFLDWLLKARELGLRTEMLPTVVLRRRIHRENMGVRERAARGDYARILQAALARRRGGQAS